MYIRM